MAKLLMPYGSKRFSQVVSKVTDPGKHANSMKDHVVTSKKPGLRFVRFNVGKG